MNWIEKLLEIKPKPSEVENFSIIKKDLQETLDLIKENRILAHKLEIIKLKRIMKLKELEKIQLRNNFEGLMDKNINEFLDGFF
jgi:hypothetical protein